jgi:hypothetical protein
MDKAAAAAIRSLVTGPEPTDPARPDPYRPIIRYANLTGAEVHVTPNVGWEAPGTYRWRCLGCLAGDQGFPTVGGTRTPAAEHAAQCRALPPLTG